MTVTMSLFDACRRMQKTRRKQRSRRMPLPSTSPGIPRSQGNPGSREILDLSCCSVLPHSDRAILRARPKSSTSRASSRNRTRTTQSIQTRTNSAAASHDRFASVTLRRRYSYFREKVESHGAPEDIASRLAPLHLPKC